jgi:ABC-type Fe3+-hydroxamate transport system substrate-binding protein
MLTSRAGWLLWLLALGCIRPPAGTGRVVSLVPSVTETIYAIGEERQLAGNTTYCNYPEAARKVYKVGDFSNPSVERIAALKPRVVFATLPEQEAAVQRLEQLGIRVVVSRPRSLELLFDDIVTVGRELGAEVRAEGLVDVLRQRLDRVATPTRPSRVYLEISEQPLMSVGGASFINEAVSRAGGRNIFESLAKEYPVVSQEQVISRDPEVVFILHPQSTARDLAARLGWQDVAAVRGKRIFTDLDPDLLFRPGPRIIQGIEELARRLQQP